MQWEAVDQVMGGEGEGEAGGEGAANKKMIHMMQSCMDQNEQGTLMMRQKRKNYAHPNSNQKMPNLQLYLLLVRITS